MGVLLLFLLVGGIVAFAATRKPKPLKGYAGGAQYLESQTATPGPKSTVRANLVAHGVNGQVRFDGEEIVIARKGAIGFLTQGLKGEKAIAVAHITSVQFKKAGPITNGYIQFAFMGGSETKAGIWDATQDENTVMFRTSQQAQFELLRDAVKRTAAEFRKPSPAAAVAMHSEADELDKLASLRDRGILTEEEFQAKKRQVLGLSTT